MAIGIPVSIVVPGHTVSQISNDAEYCGQQMVCTCGWKSRVIGISDNFQWSSLMRAVRDHEDSAAPRKRSA